MIMFLFLTSLPFALWFHIWEAEPYNGSALLFASVSLCSIWSCERAGEGGCWMIWTLACCSVFVQAALCFALRLRDTKRKISSISSNWAQMDEHNRGYFPHGTLDLSWLSVTFCLHPFLIPTSIKRGIREYFCVERSTPHQCYHKTSVWRLFSCCIRLVTPALLAQDIKAQTVSTACQKSLSLKGKNPRAP